MTKHALTILESDEISTGGGNLETFAEQALAELDAIRHMETGAALRALRFGVVIYQAKAAAKHGQFMKWQQATFKGAAKSQCNYYMRLAAAFVEKTKLDLQGVLALPAAQGELVPAKQTGAARTVLAAAIDYIDGRSLNECLADEGIKAKKKPVKRGGGSATDDKPDDVVPEQTVQERFNAIEEGVRLAREAATDRGTWMSFDRKQHDALKDLFADASAKLDAIYTKTHGRPAAKK